MKKLLALLVGMSLLAPVISAEGEQSSIDEITISPEAFGENSSELVSTQPDEALSKEADSRSIEELTAEELQALLRNLDIGMEEAILQSFSHAQLVAITKAFIFLVLATNAYENERLNAAEKTDESALDIDVLE